MYIYVNVVFIFFFISRTLFKKPPKYPSFTMRFAPSEKIDLNPPETHEFTRAELSQYNGM